jgi:hypothetical protein
MKMCLRRAEDPDAMSSNSFGVTAKQSNATNRIGGGIALDDEPCPAAANVVPMLDAQIRMIHSQVDALNRRASG